MLPTSDLNVRETSLLITPEQLNEQVPMSKKANDVVIQARQQIQDILDHKDDRLLVVIGPCSIHDVNAAKEYAQRLVALNQKVSKHLLLVMRVYFEKPRTSVGWKGLINDPDLDGTHNMEKGLTIARQLLIDINEMGLPAATEMLDPITPQYIADLISWSAIGARTTESQTHREMASGLSMPVGLKNGTDGSLTTALNAMKSSENPHHFLGINEKGQVCTISTKGNSYCHVVLRGGSLKTNYDAESVADAKQQLEKGQLRSALMVDCSHANSHKKPDQQERVLQNVVQQRQEKDSPVIGVMLESHLHEGNQSIHETPLKYGVSITDKCLGWEDTERILLEICNNR